MFRDAESSKLLAQHLHYFSRVCVEKKYTALTSLILKKM